MYPIDKNNRIEQRHANDLTFVYEWLDDGWIAIYLQNVITGKLTPLIQAMNENKADDYIILVEPAPPYLNKIC